MHRRVFNVQPAGHVNHYKTSVAAAMLICHWSSLPVGASNFWSNNSGNRLKARLSTIDS